jgi:hypothetical protein
MFSPLGYTSFKKLWDANRLAFSLAEHDFEELFKWIFEIDDGNISNWMARTLSSDELIEKVMFEVAFSEGLFLSSPSGQIVNFDVEFFKSDTNFNHILNSTPEFFDNEFRHYDSTRIYPERLTKIDDLKRAKKDPWWELRNDCGFCSINYYYDRDNYCISLDVFQKIERVSHGYMSTETLRVKECSIKPFEGWAICVLDSVAEQLSPTRLREKFVLKLICEALNLDEEDYETKPPLTTNNVGRPNISIAAAKSFMKHFSLDKKPSWKEAIAKIKEEDGLEVSVRTLQRGLKQLSDDKSKS